MGAKRQRANNGLGTKYLVTAKPATPIKRLTSNSMIVANFRLMQRAVKIKKKHRKLVIKKIMSVTISIDKNKPAVGEINLIFKRKATCNCRWTCNSPDLGSFERRRFTNHPNRPCKSRKNQSMNKSVIALCCVLNISILRIGTYSPVLTLFSCVIECYIWVG